jgi:lysophospholipase L1-like esterase
MRIFAAVIFTLFLGFTTRGQETNRPHHLQFESAIRTYEARDKTNPPPKDAVLLVGSSSIVKWTNAAAQFPEHKIINRGFGGSYLGDSVAFADRIVIPYHPKIIVLYAGDNDLAGGVKPEKVFEDFKAFVKKVRTALPQTHIAYISIKPSPSREKFSEQIKTTNRLIQEFIARDGKMTYVDVYTPMLTSDGKTRPELFVKDMLHMNEDGYKLWAGIVGPILDRSPILDKFYLPAK